MHYAAFEKDMIKIMLNRRQSRL